MHEYFSISFNSVEIIRKAYTVTVQSLSLLSHYVLENKLMLCVCGSIVLSSMIKDELLQLKPGYARFCKTFW